MVCNRRCASFLRVCRLSGRGPHCPCLVWHQKSTWFCSREPLECIAATRQRSLTERAFCQDVRATTGALGSQMQLETRKANSRQALFHHGSARVQRLGDTNSVRTFLEDYGATRYKKTRRRTVSTSGAHWHNDQTGERQYYARSLLSMGLPVAVVYVQGGANGGNRRSWNV